MICPRFIAHSQTFGFGRVLLFHVTLRLTEKYRPLSGRKFLCSSRETLKSGWLSRQSTTHLVMAIVWRSMDEKLLLRTQTVGRRSKKKKTHVYSIAGRGPYAFLLTHFSRTHEDRVGVCPPFVFIIMPHANKSREHIPRGLRPRTPNFFPVKNGRSRTQDTILWLYVRRRKMMCRAKHVFFCHS